MRRLPLVPLLAFTAALAIPLGVAAVVAAGRGETLWVALHACARAGAAAVSLLGLLALALAASAVGAALLELAHQARAGRRALRSARAGALMPAPELVAFARDLGLSRLVVVESKERIAFCAGLLRPCVAISTAVCDALEPSALRALLAHEAAHARRRDPLRQVLGAAATRALWLVPAASALAAHRRLRYELAADREAAGRAGRRSLAAALLVMHEPGQAAPSAAISGGAGRLEARVDALLGSEIPRLQLPAAILMRSALGVMLIAAVASGLALSPPAIGAPLLPMPMGAGATLEMALSMLARLMALLALWVWVHAVLGGRVWRRWPAPRPRG